MNPMDNELTCPECNSTNTETDDTRYICLDCNEQWEYDMYDPGDDDWRENA
jgi:transposase-like protein